MKEMAAPVAMEVPDTLPTSAFDYDLPDDQIARHPHQQRDESRLLTLDRLSGATSHRTFRDLVELIPAGDALVLNETRVFPARIIGRRPGGGAAEALLLDPIDGGMNGELWTALVRPGAKLRPGKSFEVAPDLSVEIVDSDKKGTRTIRLVTPLAVEEAIERYGQIPLPPYIDRGPVPEDADRYQTVYAREPGSVAAPTAGLHFTPSLLQALEEGGVRLVRVTLHVGVGTFRPVEVEDPAAHEMHYERYHVSPEAATAINETRAAGGRVWAVGTTVARTLETVTGDDRVTRAGSGTTNLFIRPPYEFRALDHLITNFHLPRSTLLMLVAAHAGHESVMKAYHMAIAEGYRLYSYGDAMVII